MSANIAGKFNINLFFIVGAIFMMIGLLLIIVGIYARFNPLIPKEFTGEAKAIITKIVETREQRRVNGKLTTYTKHRVEMTYTVDGKQYEGVYGVYTSSIVEGKEVDITYDIRDPSVYEGGMKSTEGAFILLGLGAVFLLVGGLLVFKISRISS